MIYNKPLGKTDECGTLFIMEVLDGKSVGGINIDGLFFKNNQFIIIELLRCVSVRPFQSHPNRYWNNHNMNGVFSRGNKGKFKMLWKLKEKTNGRLFLVNYEDSREQTLVIEVLDQDDNGIKNEVRNEMTFNEFKDFWHKLNDG